MSAEHSLIENREVAYDYLFRGELPYDPDPEMQNLGLAGLWRLFTKKSGPSGDKLDLHLDTVDERVLTILANHDDEARSEGNDADAIFALVDKKSTLPVVADITAQTVKIWEKALFRNKEEQMLSDQDTSSCYSVNDQSDVIAAESLVIEAAAAVTKVLPSWSSKPKNPSKTESQNLAKFLANWGPQFATKWMDGSIIKDWALQRDMLQAEAEEYINIITPSMRKHFAVTYVRDPIVGLSQVDANLKLLTDEAIVEHLGGDWTPEDVKDVFTPSIRKYLAVHNIKNPLLGLEHIDTNLKLLTDEAIVEHLGGDWTPEDVKEVFTTSTRRRLAVDNMRDPLSALKQVEANLSILTDEAIVEHLGGDWTPEDVKEVFTPSMRKRFAVTNIKDPLVALKQVEANLTLLKDEVIAEYFGGDWTPEDVKEVFTPSMRKRFAVNNNQDPLQGLKQLGANLKLLTDEAIAEHLGGEWTKEDVKEVFTPSIRKYFAVRRIKDPLAGLKQVEANLKQLTDEAIVEHLGGDWTPEDVKEVFTPGRRKYLAVNNIKDPLAGLKQVEANIKLLTDEAIAEHLEEGWTLEEVQEVFTPAIRKHFAVNNNQDPLAGLKQVGANLKLLTDEAIAEYIGEGWTVEDTRKVFTPGIRKYFAVRRIKDPLAGLKQVEANLKLLTDEAIAENLGEGWTVEDTRKVFTPSIRKYLAVNSKQNPVSAARGYIEGSFSYSGSYSTKH